MNLRHGLRYALLGLTLAILSAPPPMALAQGQDDAWEVLIAYSEDGRPLPHKRIAVRPTVAQPVYLHLRNPGVIPRANLTVKFVRLTADGKPQVLAETAVAKLLGGQTQALAFKPAAAPKEVPPKEPGKDKLPEPPPGYAPPFTFELWIDDGQQPTAKKKLPVIIQQPHEYVNAEAFYARAANQLSVKVSAKQPGFAEPECVASLVLEPELLPGLIPPKNALLIDKLTRIRNVIELGATDMQFEQSVTPKNGRIYLNIDGYDRGYGFEATLDQGVLPSVELNYRVRIKAPRYYVPKGPPPDAAKSPIPMPKPPQMLPVQLEVDGLLDQNLNVEVAFDRIGNGSYKREYLFPGLRQQSLKLAVGDDGALVLTPTVKDWQFDLNVEGIRGRKSLRVGLVNANGLSVPLADERELLLFSTDIFHKYAPLSQSIAESKIVAIYADLIVNDTGPEDVRLVALPAKATPGTPIQIKATARKRDETLQAPISKVEFFIGDSEKDPPIPGVYDAPTHLWQAEYTIPKTAKDKIAVTVKMTTSAGLAATAADSIIIAEPAEITGAIVKGVVVFNGIVQPGLDVKLFDPKVARVVPKANRISLQAVKTDSKGVYVFKDVAPGSYVIEGSKVNHEGVHAVTVVKGQALLEKQNFEIRRK